jgi:hypothetical protein
VFNTIVRPEVQLTLVTARPRINTDSNMRLIFILPDYFPSEFSYIAGLEDTHNDAIPMTSARTRLCLNLPDAYFHTSAGEKQAQTRFEM